MSNCKIFLTGGSGILGKELIKISYQYGIEFFAPSSDECDITDLDCVMSQISKFDGNIILHAAAITDTAGVEKDPKLAWDVNVMGTINILKACNKFNKKMVFISTDYVFDGKTGNYKINDPLNPIGKYAKTKTAAELIVRTYKNSLVIRTSFFGYNFPYEKAFIDQWSSKDYVDIIAPMVISETMNNKGIVHVGSNRRSLYEIAKSRNSKIKPRSMGDLKLPKDTSLLFEG